MKKVVKYNISKSGRKYQDQHGNEKTVWNNVGTLTEFYKDDGSINRVIEIPAIGLEANVFLIEPKTTQNGEKTQKTTHSGTQNPEIHVPTPEGVEYPEDDINPEDIPF
jgi:hypothetical protein